MMLFVILLLILANLPKKNKLYIIKYAIIFVAGIVMLAAKIGIKTAKPFDLPLKWLCHYILGSGKAMLVPLKEVQEAKAALFAAIEKQMSCDPKKMFGRYYCLYHSTLYEGSGFYGRPTLFYLVGGFTFLLRRDGLVSGKDRYDWHPNENGKYFTSPLGKSRFAVFVMAFLDLVFGNDWFVVKGFPCGESGISNKLWDDLHLVGAAPFWSYFDQYNIFSPEELEIIHLFEKEYSHRHVTPCNGVTARMMNPKCGIHRHYFIIDDDNTAIGVDQQWLYEHLRCLSLIDPNDFY